MLRDVDDAIFDAEHRLAHPDPATIRANFGARLNG